MLRLITAPTVEPLTAAEIKTRLDLSASVDDSSLLALVSAFRTVIDGADGTLGRALNTQTWELVLDEFPRHDGMFPGDWYTNRLARKRWIEKTSIKIPLAPLQSIVSVKYIDTLGVEQTLGVDDYELVDGTSPRIIPPFQQIWPYSARQDGAVRIQFIAGYGDLGTDVPEPIRSAITLQVGYMRSLNNMGSASREQVFGVAEKQWASPDKNDMVMTRAVKALLGPYRVYQ